MLDTLHNFSFRRLWTQGAKREEPPAAQSRPWHLGRKRTIVSPWFPLSTRDRILPLDAVDELMLCSTDIVAAPTAPLLALAEQICGGVPAPEVSVAIILFLRPGQPGIADYERDRLWHAFQAPAYQEYHGLQGGLLAWECEAQCGFHIAESIRSTAVPGTLINQPCPCGLDTPRLVDRPATLAAPTRALATTA
jgi:hypothetical protein